MRYLIFIFTILCATIPYPTYADTTNNAELQKIRQKYTFSATILPKLIRSGLICPHDISAIKPAFRIIEEHYATESICYDKKHLLLKPTLQTLQALSLFPKTMERIERVIFDTEVPLDIRLSWFEHMPRLLADIAMSIYTNRSHYSSNSHWPVAEILNPFTSATQSETLRQKIEIADLLLSTICDYIEEESPVKTIAFNKSINRTSVVPWNDYEASIRWEIPYNASSLLDIKFSFSAPQVGVIMTENWHNETFREKAKELLACGKGIPETRLDAIKLIAIAPDETIESALAAGPYLDGVSSFTACWSDMTDNFSFGVTPGGCDSNLLYALQRATESQYKITTGAQDGFGIAIEPLSATPTDFSQEGPLYILVASLSMIPDFLRDPDLPSYNVMSGTLLVGMRGPHLIPIDPKQPRDANLLYWAINTGSLQSTAVIIASNDQPEQLARRIASWHLALWEQEKENPQFVFSKPCSGSFLAAYLPLMKNEAASLFMGHEKAIWFSRPSPGSVTWYKATPQPGLQPLDAKKMPCTLEISFEHLEIANNGFINDSTLYWINQLYNEYPKRHRSVEFTKTFFETTMNELGKHPSTKAMRYHEKRHATQVLWQALDTPHEKKVHEMIFTPSSESSSERTYQARRLLEGK